MNQILEFLFQGLNVLDRRWGRCLIAGLVIAALTERLAGHVGWEGSYE